MGNELIALTPMELLKERGITAKTVYEFGIECGDNGWTYPVSNVKRFKKYPFADGPKYAWIPNKPGISILHQYSDLSQAMRESNGDCWLTTEFDYFLLYSLGIKNAIALFSETSIPENLVQILDSIGVRCLLVAPDKDKTGEIFLNKLTAALYGSDIEIIAYALPGAEKTDITSYFQSLLAQERVTDIEGKSGFERQLMKLPNLDIVTPEKVKGERATLNRNVFADDLCEAIADTLGVNAYNDTGWSKNAVLCPFHDDSEPSATWHEDGLLYCHAEGKTFSAVEVAKALELDISHYNRTRDHSLHNLTRTKLIRMD